MLLIHDRENAAYILNDLERLLGKEAVLYFPASHRRPYEVEKTENANVVLRAEVLNKLSTGRAPQIIVTHSAALTERVITKSVLKKHTHRVKTGEKISPDFLIELLYTYDFQRVDFVAEPGDFSVRGGIIDVFSYADELPYRISFFDDEVENIRRFDLESQLSVDKIPAINIIPNIDSKLTQEKRQSFSEFLPQNTLIIADLLYQTLHTIEDTYAQAEEIFAQQDSLITRLPPEQLYTQSAQLREELQKRYVLETSPVTALQAQLVVEVPQELQPAIHKDFDLLISSLTALDQKGYTIFITFTGAKQRSRLQEIFNELGAAFDFHPLMGELHAGFIDHQLQIAVFTDHQIFDRFHKYTPRNQFSRKSSITLQELNTLQVGDYVTHIDHGVGKFGGLKKIDVNGVMQEAIKLIFRDNDLLYVNIHALHKIARFSSKDGAEPKINKLGSPAWKNLKAKTKSKVKEIAFDLLKLYAQRRLEKGFAFSADSYLQKELEASFMYEDTPDQLRATDDVKKDMESERTMDRLICGDVGFGKTEVAVRAAFKAATDGKQVAVLVPTTILAFQHYQTFSERLAEFPVRVEYLNRFRSTKDKTAILKDLAEGKIDILIGTHQIVSKTVKYKDLGLLIVDEEHKFGVSVKDKLKTLRAQLDTLTLTATPIPRTLQFSLLAARDLSVIKTPPANRQPVETELIGMNEDRIRDAILYEMQRGGQIFIIYNRIAGLPSLVNMVNRLVPEAKVVMGHGQMEGQKLEKVLLNFMQGKFDVLVSTTIVESGVDVPNANTMIIVDAQMFGLADLHQMRGRVGRSNRKAFCYLITPPLNTLTNEARKRLQAIERHTELGAGFHIAMKDLEIRGAGNLLGAEQSGFMYEMGFETYQKILNETVAELKSDENFADLFAEREDDPFADSADFTFDSDIPLLIPDTYVNNVAERLNLYSDLARVKNIPDLDSFRNALIDRFGALPTAVQDLLLSVQLKLKAVELGLERVVLKNNVMLLYFLSNPQDKFFKSQVFSQIIQFIGANPSFATVKEKKSAGSLPQLFLRLDNIYTIQQAYQQLTTLHNQTTVQQSAAGKS